MNTVAIVDTAKGRNNHGKLTLHTEPELCQEAKQLNPVSSTRVTLATGFNGVVNGQWTLCKNCADLHDR